MKLLYEEPEETMVQQEPVPGESKVREFDKHEVVAFFHSPVWRDLVEVWEDFRTELIQSAVGETDAYTQGEIAGSVRVFDLLIGWDGEYKDADEIERLAELQMALQQANVFGG